MRHQDSFHAHVTAVDTLRQARIPVPSEWVAVRDRLAEYLRIEQPCTQQLAAAIVNGTKGDVATLRALALAEMSATNVHEADVTAVVRTAVHERMRALYEPVAHQNYAVAARKFNESAAKFVVAADTVNPEATGDDIIHLSERQRLAWLSAADYSETLTNSLAVLAAAAHLAGAAESDTDDAETQIPLVVGNVDKLHKRRVWTAWAASGRCGRWSAVHGLGAKITAARNPETIELYSPPRPFVQRFVLNPNTGRYEQNITDPEDTPNVPVDDGTVEWSVA